MRKWRPFHWRPRIHNGVNGVQTSLCVIGWIGIEYESDATRRRAQK